MQKDATALFTCLLILFADLLSFRQGFDLRLNGQIFNQFPIFLLLSALGVFAVFLMWINYLLIRKIINRQLNCRDSKAEFILKK